MPTLSRRDALIAVALPALLLLTWAVSYAALSGPFVFDDFPNLAPLARMEGVFDLRHVAAYLEGQLGNPGRPLSALSFLIDDAAWPSSPVSFKVTNLLIHLLDGVLVFGLVRSLARRRLGSPGAEYAALLAAAAWLLHPIQLSTSMLIVQRMTQLMTLFSLATAWWASAWLQRAPLTPWRAFVLLAGTATGTVLAYLCKENGALLPLYVMVACWTLLRADVDAAPAPARRLLLAGLWLPLLAVVAYIAWYTAHWTPDGLRDFTPAERVLTQPRVLLDYLGRIALPRLRGSGLFHDELVPSHGLLSPGTTLPALLVVLALIGSAFAWRRRAPLFAFAVLWFFGGHFMESSTLQLELYFEHRNYLPMVGPLAAGAIWLVGLPAQPRRVGLFAASAWLLLCAGLTFVQAQAWGSEKMLAELWVRENPGSIRAVEFKARALANDNQYVDAYQFIEAAVRRDPEMRRLSLDLVLLHCHLRRLTQAELDSAAAAMRETGFNRSSLEAVSMLQGRVQRAECAPPLTPDALQALIAAMLANPAYKDNKPVASFLWIELAKSRIAQNRVDADDALEAAWQAQPDADLARAAYQLMVHNRACDRAARWRTRLGKHPPSGFKGWMQRLARTAQTAPGPDICTPAKD